MTKNQTSRSSIKTHASLLWQLGDWESLLEIDLEEIEKSSDNFDVLLFCMVAYLQLGFFDRAKKIMRMAQAAGCPKTCISKFIVSGAYNSFACFYSSVGDTAQAKIYFNKSISAAMPDSDIDLLAHARFLQQSKRFEMGCQVVSRRPGDERDNEIAVPDFLVRRAQSCLSSDDPYVEIDTIVFSGELGAEELFLFYIALSDEFVKRNDKISAWSFLGFANEVNLPKKEGTISLLVKRLIQLERHKEAADIAFDFLMNDLLPLGLSKTDSKLLLNVYKETRGLAKVKAEHGHDLLIAYLNKNLKKLDSIANKKQRLLIEIGTTRENIPGQGSTRKLAEFCMNNNIHFITVDMDPHNTRVAQDMFKKLGTAFEAVTMKGEDFLAGYNGIVDFVFLDAYDFDHGGHNEMRQSRYKKFLGSAIDDVACHQMHLDCAKSLTDKLAVDGLVCFDDTWLENGKWVAKGTLGMPYFLDHGFKLIESRNRAALLSR